jgi:hypothetical protein
MPAHTLNCVACSSPRAEATSWCGFVVMESESPLRVTAGWCEAHQRGSGSLGGYYGPWETSMGFHYGPLGTKPPGGLIGKTANCVRYFKPAALPAAGDIDVDTFMADALKKIEAKYVGKFDDLQAFAVAYVSRDRDEKRKQSN